MPDTALCSEWSSTPEMTPGESRELWRRIATSYQCNMTCDFPDGDEGTSTLTRLRTERNQVLAWRSPQVRYRRRSEHMREDGIDSYVLLLPVAGAVDVSVDFSRTTLRPGYGALIATTQPFDVTHTHHARLRAVTIERRTIHHRLNKATEFVAPIDLAAGLGGVVHDLLDSALRMADQLSSNQFDAVVDRLIELVCVLVGTDMVNAGDHFSEIEAAIRRYVRDNAHEPDLNSEMIAAALGWSVRQIQLALQRAGTTSRELIKEERLSLAHDRLVSPAYNQTTITELAHRCGFASPGRFSTAFRERFGMTPRELRGTHR
ncbi:MULTISPECIES: AraC family transcriptional regulator [Prauserella]|nr:MULTISPECIES: AraC family transcriptional regulator [Prauserella]